LAEKEMGGGKREVEKINCDSSIIRENEREKAKTERQTEKEK
jgi:hypothetical protein